MSSVEINALYKSVLDIDRAQVVICDLEHTVVYMNKSAVSIYGKNLTGSNLMNCHNSESKKRIEQVVDWFKVSPENNIIYTFRNEKLNKDVYMVALRDAEGGLIGYYEKHEFRSRESAALYDFSKSL